MNMPDDAGLKRDFERLRQADQRAVPDFRTTIAAGQSVAARRRESRRRAVVAAGLLFAAAAGLLVSRSHRAADVPLQQSSSLVNWASPTASLLRTPGWQLSNEIPPLDGRQIYGLPGQGRE